MKKLIILFLAFLNVTIVSAQDVRYYKLTRKIENGNSSTNVSGGQFITFISDICYESNKKGIDVGHGSLTRNNNYSNSQYSVYQGSSYWGKDATFKFNTDKSILNVVLENGDIYVYKKGTAPAGQETCSLIRKPSTTTGGGSVVVTPQPVIVNPYNPTPTPSPTPTPTPTPTPSQQTQHKCGLCNGTGRVINTDGVSFGNTKWCSECGKTVPDNHYHTTCPSCKGKGYW